MSTDFEQEGTFMVRAGASTRAGDRRFCNKKLCFTATDQAYLVGVLRELSDHELCHRVKYSREPRDGMYLGRAHFRDPVLVGELWARYKVDKKLFCSVQDDDFTVLFRERFHGFQRTP